MDDDTKFCRDCGAEIQAKAEICPACGLRQLPVPGVIQLGNIAPNGRSKLAAILLAFFLGGFGIHKFYLGQIGWGILYLLLCWTFIPAFVSIIEAILLLVMSDERFNAKFGQS